MIDKVKEARRDNWIFAVKIFALGQGVGIPLGALYMTHSSSDASPFHAFVMWAGAGITFPLFSISIRIMLKMYYKALEQEEALMSLVESAKGKEKEIAPVIDRFVDTVEKQVIPTMEKASSAIDKVTANGELEKTLGAIKKIPAELQAIRKASVKSAMKDI